MAEKTTTAEPETEPETVHPLHCKNKECGHLYGETTAKRLNLGSAFITNRTVLTCPVCGTIRVWRPGRPKLSD